MTNVVDVDAIAGKIINQAAASAGDTWNVIRKSAPIYIKGYAQALAEISIGVKKGEISKAEAEIYAANAQLILEMGIANTAQIVLFEVQQLIDGVISLLKGSINAALPVPILGK